MFYSNISLSGYSKFGARTGSNMTQYMMMMMMMMWWFFEKSIRGS